MQAYKKDCRQFVLALAALTMFRIDTTDKSFNPKTQTSIILIWIYNVSIFAGNEKTILKELQLKTINAYFLLHLSRKIIFLIDCSYIKLGFNVTELLFYLVKNLRFF